MKTTVKGFGSVSELAERLKELGWTNDAGVSVVGGDATKGAMNNESVTAFRAERRSVPRPSPQNKGWTPPKPN